MVDAVLTQGVSFKLLNGKTFTLESGAIISVKTECNYAVYDGVRFFLFEWEYSVIKPFDISL